ncbi:MAG: dihydroneopterin aldolase [Pseudomonadota bacterium]
MGQSEQQDQSNVVASHAVAQRIVVKDHIFFVRIGVTEEERAKLQRLCLNLTIDLAPKPPSRDDIAEVLSYGLVIRLVRQVYRETEFKLLESLLESLAAKCFEFPGVTGTKMRLEKLDRYADTGAVGVEIERRRES